MRTLVLYYSRKGSNRFLARKMAESLACECEQIRPRVNNFLFFLMKIDPGIRSLKHKPGEYDKVILCGPIWMGRIIPPLRRVLTHYGSQIRELVFVSCCGSTDARKDEKFGHGIVFREVEGLMEGKPVTCRAFPIDLVLPADKKEDGQAIMNTRLSEENFAGEIRERFNDLIFSIKK